MLQNLQVNKQNDCTFNGEIRTRGEIPPITICFCQFVLAGLADVAGNGKGSVIELK
jgi:hypothetical protein